MTTHCDNCHDPSGPCKEDWAWENAFNEGLQARQLGNEFDLLKGTAWKAGWEYLHSLKTGVPALGSHGYVKV